MHSTDFRKTFCTKWSGNRRWNKSDRDLYIQLPLCVNWLHAAGQKFYTPFGNVQHSCQFTRSLAVLETTGKCVALHCNGQVVHCHMVVCKLILAGTLDGIWLTSFSFCVVHFRLWPTWNPSESIAPMHITTRIQGLQIAAQTMTDCDITHTSITTTSWNSPKPGPRIWRLQENLADQVYLLIRKASFSHWHGSPQFRLFGLQVPAAANHSSSRSPRQFGFLP